MTDFHVLVLQNREKTYIKPTINPLQKSSEAVFISRVNRLGVIWDFA
jgi:hypothetical protein